MLSTKLKNLIDLMLVLMVIYTYVYVAITIFMIIICVVSWFFFNLELPRHHMLVNVPTYGSMILGTWLISKLMRDS